MGTYRYTHTHIHKHTYIHIYIYTHINITTGKHQNGMPQTVKLASHIQCVTTASHVTGGEVVKQNCGEVDVTGLARERRAQVDVTHM